MVPFWLVSSYRLSSCTTHTLKMEAENLSETIYQFTWPHISEDLNVLQHRCSKPHLLIQNLFLQKIFHWR